VNQNDFFEIIRKVPTQKVNWLPLKKFNIELWVRRDDLLDAEVSGNKFYKLWVNLQQAECKGFRRLLTFGGPWSNHIHAVAAAGKRFGFDTIGFIRGEAPAKLNACLTDAAALSMQLNFLSRDQYQRRYEPDFQAFLAKKYNAFVIPEGGGNLAGAEGMQLLGQYLQTFLETGFTAVCLASGTGTSLAGLAAGVDESLPVYGFSVLKGEGDLAKTVRRFYEQLKENKLTKNSKRDFLPTGDLLPTQDLLQAQDLLQKQNWRLISGFHAGGYARKHPDYLKSFWKDFEQQTSILLDPIYTLKLFWGITSLVEQGFWPSGSKLLAIHSGGLQGRRGFECPG
jgi:1-aminocyclopropane-1-carboxylate deaminase